MFTCRTSGTTCLSHPCRCHHEHVNHSIKKYLRNTFLTLKQLTPSVPRLEHPLPLMWLPATIHECQRGKLHLIRNEFSTHSSPHDQLHPLIELSCKLYLCCQRYHCMHVRSPYPDMMLDTPHRDPFTRQRRSSQVHNSTKRKSPVHEPN